MEYTLDLSETLRIMFVDENGFSIFRFIVEFLLLPLAWFICSSKRYRWKLAIAALICVSLVNYPIYGSGWRIDKEMFYMKAYIYSAEIPIHTMQIAFIDVNSQWFPKGRHKVGMECPTLDIGKYVLKNKETALLFNHYNNGRYLLISSGNEYYLVGGENGNRLYQELIRFGARKKLVDCEVRP